MTGRTIESLPDLTWWLAFGYSFAGWIMANLKNAVLAMNGDENKTVAAAGIIAGFVAAMLVGVSSCLYVLTEVQIDSKPAPLLVALFVAVIGAAGGMGFVSIGIDVVKGIAVKWGQGSGGQQQNGGK